MRNFKLILGLALLTACAGTKKRPSDYSLLYLDDPSLVHPEYMVYHSSETETEVHFRIKSSEVLYGKFPGDSAYSANLRLSYKLFSDYDNRQIADSGKVNLKETGKPKVPSYLMGEMTIQAVSGKDYVLEIMLNDLNRDLHNRSILTVNKSKKSGRQYFFVSDSKGIPVFNYHIVSGRSYNIKTNLDPKYLQIRGYHRETPLPPPPFSVEQTKPQPYKADHTEVLTSSLKDFAFTAAGNGVYHIVPDSTKREGLTLFAFNGGFPKVKTTDEMITAVRYITSKNEFKNINNSSDRKYAFERFWLSVTNNPERAKLAIKEYYSRVQNCNKFFSSHVEGWKSDRGLIYIVYGPPNIIHKKDDAESWIYGEEGNMLSVNFTFFKVDNPFSDNDYVLSRSPLLKNSWYRAVDTWRQGRVF